ncbi:MAG: hypothetical protein JRJ84_10855, partial [Deltaproteobacteria bacterium]|nr:hypothetical protein [Deltaproteobacteria bacterium]
MSVRRAHILRQTPVIAALVRTAAVAAARKAGFPPKKQVLPGPTLTATVPPRSPELVKDYLRAVGAERSWYRGVLPPHLFPHWAFPLLSKTLTDIPYDMTRVLNGGCRMEMNEPLAADGPLHLRANLEGIDDDGRRAVLHQRIITGTDTEPDALVCHMYSIVPLKRDKGGKKKER